MLVVRLLGETGEITDWQGEPDETELAIGLPRVIDDETDVLVGETDVNGVRVAAAWSVSPTDLDGRRRQALPRRRRPVTGADLVAGVSCYVG
jgi:hypothetical protein